MIKTFRDRSSSIAGYPPFHGVVSEVGVTELLETSDIGSVVELHHWFTITTRPDSGYEFYVEHNGRFQISVGDHVRVEFDHQGNVTLITVNGRCIFRQAKS